MNTYLATVTEDNYVIVTVNGIEVNRPGPWDTSEGAHIFAARIVEALENGTVSYGNQKEA